MAAREFLKSLEKFQAEVEGGSGETAFPRTQAALAMCKDSVLDELPLEIDTSRQGQKRTDRELNLMRQVRYFKNKLQKMEEEARKSQRQKGLISNQVFLKVCLSQPSVNNRQLKELLAEDGVNAISHTYIGRVRDAFAEILKDHAKDRLTQVMCSAAVGVDGDIKDTLYMVHIHDEASMRLRSFDRVAVDAFGSDGLGPVFSRGRYSQVQNNVLHLHLSSATTPLEWFCDLQPLGRKDGATLATALMRTVDEVLAPSIEAVKSRTNGRVKVVHLMVGDGIGTNEDAATRVLHRYALARGPESKINYRLLVLKCASHQANLAVLVAICGRLGKDVAEADELSGILSRMYKFLLPSYLDEFAALLRNKVVDTFVLHNDVDSVQAKAFQEQTVRLVALYGEHVLPPQAYIVAQSGHFKNGTLGARRD